MKPENERALWFLTNRARYYAQNGKTTCGTCGVEPERQPIFNPLMACGHPWSALVWTPTPRHGEEP